LLIVDRRRAKAALKPRAAVSMYSAYPAAGTASPAIPAYTAGVSPYQRGGSPVPRAGTVPVCPMCGVMDVD